MFRGFDPERDRLVAIKLFRLDLPPDRVHRLVAALQRLTSGALRHPAFAAPIAAGMQENAAYLVQEYVASDSLDVVLRDQGPAPLADALRVARELADAVDAGVAHGAIHPRDVLLSSHDVRVTGFGIGPALEQVGVAPPLRRPYTAPERLAGASWDRRADIFSIAAVMYEVLTGKRITGTGEAGVPGLAHVSGANLAALTAVFGRALAENPADRHETASAFAEELAKAHVGSREVHAGSREAHVARRDVEPSLPLEEPDLPLHTPPAATKPATPRTPAPAPPRAKKIVEPPPMVGEPAPAVDVQPPAPPVVKKTAPAIEPEPPPGQPEPRPKPTPEPRPSPPTVPPPIVPPQPAAMSERPPSIRQAPRLDSRPSAVPAATPMVPERPVVAQSPMLLSALDRSRSAMWPLALAFVVGLGLGIPFGFGLYPVMSQQRPPESASAQPAPSAGGSPRTAAQPPARAPQTTAPGAQPTAPGTQTTASAAQSAAPATPGTGAPAQTAAAQAAAPPPVDEPAPPAAASTRGRAVQQAGRAPAPPAPAPAPPANPGRMLIRTTPAGARVFVDGRDHGASPAEVRGLAVGVHTVRVVRAGYADEERSVAVTAERPAQNLTIALTRAAAAAPTTPAGRAPLVTAARNEPLRIESRPAGAQVFLDGRLIGTTPLVVSDVALGGHQVRLQLEGYRPWAVSTDVIAGGDNHVTASLER